MANRLSLVAPSRGVIRPNYPVFDIRVESREDRVLRADKVAREKQLRQDRRAALSPQLWS